MPPRRSLFALLAALFPGMSLAAAGPSAVEAVLSPTPPTNSAAVRHWVSPPNCYFAYPHTNSFLPGSNLPVIARIDGTHIELCEWNFQTGATRKIYRTAAGNMYWDIARNEGGLYLVEGRKFITRVGTGQNPTPNRLSLSSPPGQKLQGMLSVSADGKRVVYARECFASDGKSIQSASFDELALGTGISTPLCDMPFSADHMQYCPHDESWIGFAHEGNDNLSHDRVWGLHHVPGAKPEPLWNEIAANGKPLIVGHERWAFHTTGALVVAYPDKLGHPCGLYFIDVPALDVRLVSASSYDWHCNISQDGQWAVVDTSPPHGRRQEDDGKIISDVVLVHIASGQRQWIARSHPSPMGHPWHPHPHFSPDGRYVLYNDFAFDGAGNPGRVVAVELAPSIPA